MILGPNALRSYGTSLGMINQHLNRLFLLILQCNNKTFIITITVANGSTQSGKDVTKLLLKMYLV